MQQHRLIEAVLLTARGRRRGPDHWRDYFKIWRSAAEVSQVLSTCQRNETHHAANACDGVETHPDCRNWR